MDMTRTGATGPQDLPVPRALLGSVPGSARGHLDQEAAATGATQTRLPQPQNARPSIPPATPKVSPPPPPSLVILPPPPV